MTDQILIMDNHGTTLSWIMANLPPADNDSIIAVEQHSPFLSFANKREYLAPYPGPAWADTTIYTPGGTPNERFLLLNIGDSDQTCQYILSKVGSNSDNVVAVRTTGTVITFADATITFGTVADGTRGTIPWTGPTSINCPAPCLLSSGVLIPGKNWREADDFYVVTVGRLLGIDPLSDLFTYVVEALQQKPEDVTKFLSNPGEALSTIQTRFNMQLPADMVTNVTSNFVQNGSLLRQVLLPAQIG